MRTCLQWLMVCACVLALSCTATQAQEEDRDLEIVLPHIGKSLKDSAKLTEASEKLSKKVQEMNDLLDVDEMEEDVADRIELNKKESKKVRALLEDFRGHWMGDGSHSVTMTSDDDDDWFKEMAASVAAFLDEDDARDLVRWLKKKKKAADACGEEITEAAEVIGREAGKLGEEMGEWAEEYGEEISDWAEVYGEEMNEWAEVFSGEMAEKLQKDLGNMEIFTDDFNMFDKDFGQDWAKWGEEMADWAEEYAGQYEDLAVDFDEDFAADLEDWAEDLAERIEISVNENMDEETLRDLRKSITISMGEVDWATFSEQIAEAVEVATEAQEISGMLDADFQKDMRKYAEDVSRASEDVRKALGAKRVKLQKASKGQWGGLMESLRKMGALSEDGNQSFTITFGDEEGEKGAYHFDDHGQLKGSGDLKNLGERIRKKMEVMKRRTKAAHPAHDSAESAVEKLQKEEALIRKREKEIKKLQDKIKALKKELRDMEEYNDDLQDELDRQIMI